MKYFYLIITILFLVSCGYPDIDDVPDFKEIKLTDQELSILCSDTDNNKKNMDKCNNGYKSNK